MWGEGSQRVAASEVVYDGHSEIRAVSKGFVRRSYRRGVLDQPKRPSFTPVPRAPSDQPLQDPVLITVREAAP